MVTVGIPAGRFAGACFWKKHALRIPSGQRSSVTARPFIHGTMWPAIAGVELREIELGQAVVRPEWLRRVGDDSSAQPDARHRHASPERLNR